MAIVKQFLPPLLETRETLETPIYYFKTIGKKIVIVLKYRRGVSDVSSVSRSFTKIGASVVSACSLKIWRMEE